MKKNIKQIIKSLPLIKAFIYKFIHPHIKSKKIAQDIDFFFSCLSEAKKKFDKVPKIPNLIVSLTSFPARMEFIEYTLFSLIQQNIRPEKIILWLSEQEFTYKENFIPDNIEKYKQFGLEIKFVKDNFKSFNKIFFSLLEYPEKTIVTVDDDVFYKQDLLKLLYTEHKLFPTDIISNKVRRISFKKKRINPYQMWKNYKHSVSFLNFLLGYSGVLYPPHCLYKDANESLLFEDLCPYADDIWYYTMALLANTKIRRPKYLLNRIYPIDYQLSDKWKDMPELLKINLTENRNDSQLKSVLSYYSIFENFFEKYA